MATTCENMRLLMVWMLTKGEPRSCMLVVNRSYPGRTWASQPEGFKDPAQTSLV